jgi:hypothetical protein
VGLGVLADLLATLHQVVERDVQQRVLEVEVADLGYVGRQGVEP